MFIYIHVSLIYALSDSFIYGQRNHTKIGEIWSVIYCFLREVYTKD